MFLEEQKADVFKKPEVPPLKNPKQKLLEALQTAGKCYSNPRKAKLQNTQSEALVKEERTNDSNS